MDLTYNYCRKNHADKQGGKDCAGFLLRHRQQGAPFYMLTRLGIISHDHNPAIQQPSQSCCRKSNIIPDYSMSRGEVCFNQVMQRSGRHIYGTRLALKEGIALSSQRSHSSQPAKRFHGAFDL
jgi:hypothetical protein